MNKSSAAILQPADLACRLWFADPAGGCHQCWVSVGRVLTPGNQDGWIHNNNLGPHVLLAKEKGKPGGPRAEKSYLRQKLQSLEGV